MVKKLEVDRNQLQRVITELESRQSFPNPTALWKAVEESDWAKNHQPRPVTSAIAYDRARELGIQYKTKAAPKVLRPLTEGQRAAMQAARKNRKPRSEKMKAFASTFAAIREAVPARFLPLVAQAEKGGLRPAIKLTCLECSNYQMVEVKACPIIACALFPHRPYQRSLEEAEVAVDGQEQDDTEE